MSTYMNQAMPHADDSGPWNLRSLLARVDADLARSLPDDLERVNQGECQHLILVQVVAPMAHSETDCRIQGIDNVVQADTIIGLHIAPVPCARPGRGNIGSSPARCAGQLFALAAAATVPVRSQPW